uniref:Reverse transcriptase domain-containing protein n=1 Tax=Tanacetum cinerariifolium TaxID=118510 RepID=A0A6L2JQP0_TANCI|nr:reverse transcriptase domain-containing protein [Tanacetum cinerariifolium]
MDAIVTEDHTHRRSVMTNPWEDLKNKKPTMPTEDIEETDIEETTTIEVPEIGVTSGKTYDPPVNQYAKTIIIHDDSEDEAGEAEKEVEPSSSKQGRPFLHTADAIIRVKYKELNLGVMDDTITFLIDKAMQYSHSNDDTCFRMDVIDEVTEEELDALLNDSKPFLNTSKKINETSLDKEFKEFVAVDVEETPKQKEEIKNNFEELTLEENLRIKTSI